MVSWLCTTEANASKAAQAAAAAVKAPEYPMMPRASQATGLSPTLSMLAAGWPCASGQVELGRLGRQRTAEQDRGNRCGSSLETNHLNSAL